MRDLTWTDEQVLTLLRRVGWMYAYCVELQTAVEGLKGLDPVTTGRIIALRRHLEEAKPQIPERVMFG